MNTDIIAYYKARAGEYEKVYSLSERQPDLHACESELKSRFAHKNILEIACGTGYWTERIAQTAQSIYGIDINESVLEIARSKTYSPATVQFNQADLFHFKPEKPYDALFGGFIWSHILLEELDDFLNAVHACLKPGALVIFMDNNYVAGSNYPIAERDEKGNSYQIRTLENGTVHKVLKNFPDAAFFESKLEGKVAHWELVQTTYYWILSYTLKL